MTLETTHDVSVANAVDPSKTLPVNQYASNSNGPKSWSAESGTSSEVPLIDPSRSGN